ncbi:MAG: hypothetical protein LIP02_12540 [Bacteroidales bacterium]|nr:hypothetical protein [Bacteroidales bacterium]
MKPRLHVISIQNPFPPTYGGVIDIYYRLKALHKAGWGVVLHTYAYKGREHIHDTLRGMVDDLNVYHRREGIISQLSNIPYIVNSRRDSKLLKRLLEDDAPILFEGLHNCYFLGHPALRERLKVVRAHNVEHEYYRHLARATTSMAKRVYYALEAEKLKHYENVLRHATMIAAISPGEQEYFNRRFPDVETFHLPCFYDDSPVEAVEREPYVLYHANLAVEENEHAARWIAENVVDLLPQVRFIFAGANPSNGLVGELTSHPNVELRANVPAVEMNELIARAQVTLFVTFQATGVKLKLLSSLHKGAHVVVNSLMVDGTELGQCCDVADGAEEIAAIISKRISEPFMGRTLPSLYSNDVAIQELIRRL